MIRFPFPTKFVATNRKEFNIRVEKPNKRSWWINLLDDDGKVVKTIKVSKASIKLRYPTKEGGLASGPVILRTLLKDRPTDLSGTSNRQKSR